MKNAYILVLLFFIFSACEEEVKEDELKKSNIIESLINDIKSTPNLNPYILLDKYVYDFESIEADSAALKLYMEEMILLKNYIVDYPDEKFKLLYGSELENTEFRLWNPEHTRDSICDECAVYYMLSKHTERVSFCTRGNKIFSMICDWDYANEGMVWY